MSRYRLYPTPAQEAVMRQHCAHARFVWNLAAEQQSWWRRGRKGAPRYLEQSRQLTAARSDNEWLLAGSQMVQQQALRDFEQALRNFFAGTHRMPGFRKASGSNGFRIVGERGGGRNCKWDVRRLNRHWGQVKVPKVGWVRFRWSRAVPDAKSYRVTLDPTGRWHVAFAAIPGSVAGPGTGYAVGVDRGVKIAVTLSTGEMHNAPHPSAGHRRRLLKLQRKLARAKRGSSNRERVRVAIARLRAKEARARKDWAEKLSTDLARRFDVIRIEDLNVRGMTRSAGGTIVEPGRSVRQKTGLNRAILAAGWGTLVGRLEQKAPGRVQKISPAFTSQTCSACGTRDREARESQASFRCRSCGHAENADVNAAKNIAAGHAVTARGGTGKLSGPVNREPQAA